VPVKRRLLLLQPGQLELVFEAMIDLGVDGLGSRSSEAMRPPRPIPEPVGPDPEPIRPVEVLPPVYALPPLDPAIDFPDAPPPVEPEHHGPYAIGPYAIGGPVSAPVRLEAPTPVYPEMARIVRRECTVLIKSVIDESGRVTEIEVEQECPFGMTEAAVDAVERWRYRPATRTGLPVPVYMNLRVAFTLD
jgi:TonB family protein